MREGLVRGGHSGTFTLLAVLSAVEGAIATWLAVKFQRNHNAPNGSIRDRTNLIAFNSWFTFLFSVIYLGLFLHSAHGSILVSVGSHAIFLIIIWILWTAGVASITASLGGGINCSKINYELVYCNQLNAEMGFGWAIW
ncbi:hypothetical protein FRB90_003610 [Tulasnella sp. 427]|nr:hypothetical protein FRB90_003610 [Tulasnella sp. 427]